MTQAQPVMYDSSQIRRSVAAGAIGTIVEYYDFTLYATASALVFNKIFFTDVDPLIGTLAAFSTFFVGYVARPLGGMIFGHFGDKFGRKRMLILTMILMGLGTFAIGLVPDYRHIGIWAPILLVTLRLLQGIGIGGEYGGGVLMAIEHSPPHKQGLIGSLVHIGVPAGFLLPIAFLGLMTRLPEDQFLAWGWRG
ncbi:MAG TPA: MFS transporter, partial [Pseudomonas sp.]|nr:MFS transporter [Pseudomonas sp.]